MPEGEEAVGQGLVLDAGWGKAEAGDDPLRKNSDKGKFKTEASTN